MRGRGLVGRVGKWGMVVEGGEGGVGGDNRDGIGGGEGGGSEDITPQPRAPESVSVAVDRLERELEELGGR